MQKPIGKIFMKLKIFHIFPEFEEKTNSKKQSSKILTTLPYVTDFSSTDDSFLIFLT